MSGYPRPRGVTPRRLVELRDALPTDPAVVRSPLPGELTVTGITHASSDVRPGDLYAGLPGANRHGAEFAAAAATAGAVALLTDVRGAELAAPAGLPTLVVADPRAVLGPLASAVYGDPTHRLPVIGLTGTAGKTSTAYLVEAGLRAAGHRTCLIGTVETRVGDTVIDSVRTTPEATDLHALFAAALEDGVTAAVMEVSSHALAYGRVGGVRFAVGGWTNFGSDHLDFHRDLDDYFAAKAALFDGRCGAEVLNLDDQAVRRLVRPATVTYSAAGDPAATWRATDVRPAESGQRFTAHGPGGLVLDAAVRLPGLHNVANALLALASLAALGVDPAVAAKGVADCPGVPGRLERVAAPGPVAGFVDYAHKAGAIVAALAALRESLRDGGRLICVIGAGGDRDKGKRPVMGAAAAEGADLVIVTDDNPRTEDPAAIRAQVLAGATGAGEVIEVAGRRAAIAEAVRLARPGDVIALLGKGHERGQEVNGQVHPFDDRVVLAEALAGRFAGAVA
ncbi:UDP-N-acetylmuramoyl-L-alanyl-D-glutamate--2,6-diaminopimelate ligase [Luedemannella helvata]|uniref:UDP-N-acetylmuramoyl-L-alanyl-D-glutamate--2,6-diaminopimelate ligase n=1 Tax=Luedemannella helvata TaxID=349315 RepID=A0ABP4W054_9ACTN